VSNPSFFVGMAGPGCAIEIRLPDPFDRVSGLTVDIMSASTRSFSALFRFSDGSTLTLSTWTITTVSADLVKAVYVPIASDFTVPGSAIIESSITLDGVVYPYRDKDTFVRPRP
jgi:hypothetical protein